MRLKFCLLGESAFVDNAQRLSITQIFDYIESVSFPAMHSRMSIVTKWEFEENDDKTKDYIQKLTIINNNTNKEILDPVESSLRSTSKDNQFLQFIVNIQSLILPDEGEYTIRVALGKKIEKVIFKAIKLHN